MTEFRETINVSTGNKETVEYYTHNEFIARKKLKLEELQRQASDMGSIEVSSLSLKDVIAHGRQCISLYNEWQRVRGAVGPMIVSGGSS